ncbi:DegV family EDD domain-containing protein [Pontibacillus yanchengensis]|uniref:DegV family EDD domain-containing protein n=2 Tax=Pontibacillus yanchengensis TaxID=462910 RepID=A0ACC7VDI5_9BACI|nr:DegV family protein [Pontibacillus yanchengensis]MYL32262.1 DegV family EDD domain-containing protein [Pontibacillus yanchengensis]MYL52842.1 DegV family EDD domain-containing protein [Pontibacillus yanchengensis]
MNVQIITDSGCDLPNSLIEKYNIIRVPLTVHLDNEDYLDAVTIDSKQVYDAMRNGKEPKTSQVSPQTFKEQFEACAKEGKTCIYFALSSELSGTYQTGKMMQQEVNEEYPDFDFQIIDTHCASLGFGLVVLRAAQLAHEGASAADVVEMGTYHMNHMEHIFTVDDLEYLKRGGRVSKTAAFVGTMLKIKPLLHVEEGKLIPLEKIRGSKKVIKRMIEVMEERGQDFNNQIVAISHGDDLERANQLAEQINEQFNPKDIVIHPVGSSIGAHSGPGTIALFFLNDSYK